LPVANASSATLIKSILNDIFYNVVVSFERNIVGNTSPSP